MNFTQEQISGLMLDIANSENDTNLLMQLTLNAFMKSERHLHQQENPEDYANGYRERKARGFGKEMLLKVPRTRDGSFYPVLLNVLRNEDEEHRKLIFSLYRRGLTTEQVSDVYEEIYGKDYSKQQISYLMKDSREEVSVWLTRKLEPHYLVLYIDAKRRFRTFNILDDYNSEALHIEVDFSLQGNRIVWVLNHLINRRGRPKKIRMDNGPEFIATITSNWSKMHGIDFQYIQPGKPTQTAFVERFNGSYRRGVLDKYIFETIAQVREQTEIWMQNYNNYRPHDGLGEIPPKKYAELNSIGACSNRMEKELFDN